MTRRAPLVLGFPNRDQPEAEAAALQAAHLASDPSVRGGRQPHRWHGSAPLREVDALHPRHVAPAEPG